MIYLIISSLVTIDSMSSVVTENSAIGGGTMCLLSNDLRFVQKILSPTDQQYLGRSFCELACFDLLLPGCKFRFILVYRPPSSCFKDNNLSDATCALIVLLQKLSSVQHTTIIVGDFNLPVSLIG